MDDVKREYREVEKGAKKAWRNADGHEDLGDKLGNAGDEIRTGLGNVGDDIAREIDRQTDDRDDNDRV
jgi:hypothetical protein